MLAAVYRTTGTSVALADVAAAHDAVQAGTPGKVLIDLP